jgi:hypothetical protein
VLQDLNNNNHHHHHHHLPTPMICLVLTLLLISPQVKSGVTQFPPLVI